MDWGICYFLLNLLGELVSRYEISQVDKFVELGDYLVLHCGFKPFQLFVQLLEDTFPVASR